MEKVLILRDKTDYPKEDGYYLVKWHEDYRGFRTDSYFDLERKWDHAERKFIIGWYEEVELSSIKVAGETPKVPTDEEIEKMADEYANRFMDGKDSFYGFKAGFKKAQEILTPPTLQGDNPKR